MRLLALVFALSIAAVAGSNHGECPRKTADCPRHGDSTAVLDSSSTADSAQCMKKKDCCKKAKSHGECPRKKEQCPKKAP